MVDEKTKLKYDILSYLCNCSIDEREPNSEKLNYKSFSVSPNLFFDIVKELAIQNEIKGISFKKVKNKEYFHNQKNWHITRKGYSDLCDFNYNSRMRGTFEELIMGLKNGEKENMEYQPTPEEIADRQKFIEKYLKIIKEDI